MVLPLCILAVALKSGAPVEASVAIPHTSVPARFLTLMPTSSTFAYAAQDSGVKPAVADPLPDGKGKELTRKICSGCHAVAMFADQRHDHDQWSAVIDAMISKGLDATDDQLNEINEYLATYLGPKKDSDPSTPK